MRLFRSLFRTGDVSVFNYELEHVSITEYWLLCYNIYVRNLYVVLTFLISIIKMSMYQQDLIQESSRYKFLDIYSRYIYIPDTYYLK